MSSHFVDGGEGLWLSQRERTWRGQVVVGRRRFHAALPGYQPTPLRSLPNLAKDLAVGAVMVKDESRRFELPAFKILGASWGVYRALLARLGRDLPRWRTTADLQGYLAPLRHLVLLTATAGNHGRAVARMARWLGFPCVVVVPGTLSAAAVDRIRCEGAEIRTVDGTYDDAVVWARDTAEHDDSYLLVQDTAWPGYELVPEWIVEGYDTLFQEIDDEIGSRSAESALVIVPVGVGSLLAAAIRHYHAPGRDGVPAIGSVEPATAACVLASVRANRPVAVRTEGAATAMAGLNAGSVSTTAWPVIRQALDLAIAVDDGAAVRAQDVLHRGGVQAGLCGSATLAGARAALAGGQHQAVRQALGLNRDSTIILISTDGSW